ncbi:MAG: MBL fold metallo-hydrolase [Candidatus Thiodiazotropha sp. (ex Gloverina cf. vestifex)]|nr:MBL fold metallo-hydrolase [Candidatus Thiodiazotropha sp. (ex Gloverina cf. vestifex)]
MQVRQLFDNQSSTYTYIVWDEASREAAIIDAVIEQVDRDVSLIQQLDLELRYALETHIHADHITGSGRLREYLGCEIGVHLQAGSECADLELVDGDRIQLGSQHLEVLYTPGHTDTDICLLGNNQACRYLVKDFGTSESPKSTRQRDSRYAPIVLRPPRFRIAHCSRAACALLHHDSRK